MAKYIPLDTLVAEIEKRISEYKNCGIDNAAINAKIIALESLLIYINTLEAKEVNEVPATVMVNKYGNRFISSWSGLKEYDDFNEGEEIKILIPKK